MAMTTLQPGPGPTSGGSPPGPEKQIDPDYEIASNKSRRVSRRDFFTRQRPKTTTTQE